MGMRPFIHVHDGPFGLISGSIRASHHMQVRSIDQRIEGAKTLDISARVNI
jgi:hypothetical protein